MPGLSASGTSSYGLTAPGPFAFCLSSTFTPGSLEYRPLSWGPSKLGSSIFYIDIEEVLNKFSRCHPH